jgi:small-conductance mechanosensitive channel
MAELLDVGTVGVIVGIVFFTAVMLWAFARMSRYFEYLKAQPSRLLDRDTLTFIHHVLEWFWVGLMIIVVLFIGQSRSEPVRVILKEIIPRLPSIAYVTFVILSAGAAARVTRRFAAYLRGELPTKPEKLAPPHALSIAETIIRILIWVAAAFAAYLGGVALLPLGDRVALSAVLPSFQAPSAGTLLTLAVAGLVVFVGVRIIDSVFDDLARRRRAHFNQQVAESFRSLVRLVAYASAGFFLVVLALTLSLDPAQMTTLGVFAIAFALLLAVAVLASRDVIGGVMAGFSLMLSDPFAPGDRVHLGDEEVEIVTMQLTATQVRNSRGELLRIPNADLAAQRFANLSRTPSVKLVVPIRLPVDVPHARVEALLLRSTEGVPGIKSDPAPRILATSLGGGALEYRIVAQVNSPAKKAEAESQVLFRVQELCLAEGLRLL